MREYTFTATIEPTASGGAFILFPYDVEQEFATRGRVAVTATFDGVPYTGSLVRYGHPQHMLPMLKSIRDRIGKAPGETVNVVLRKDDGVRTLDVPPDLLAAFKSGGVLPLFEKLSFTHRKEFCRWITEAKREETRQRRIEKAMEMLKAGVKTPL